jgi:ABC-type antimicrobial peptide transport system permease subunit
VVEPGGLVVGDLPSPRWCSVASVVYAMGPDTVAIDQQVVNALLTASELAAHTAFLVTLTAIVAGGKLLAAGGRR